MRLLRLELAGFGPYRERFEIDFASFEADGLYLIAGPTGAGKSTILDAITYALYGSAPRYDGAPHVRSDLAGPTDLTWVELELAVGDRVLRVRRSPEYDRPKQRGTGLTRERASATLEERSGDGWRLLSSSVAEVGTEVGSLLGLRKDEFLKVILLAQGGFAEFLAATSEERKALLERLFGTGSMRRLRELLLADAKAVAAERESLERVRDERGARAADAARSLRDGEHEGGEASAEGTIELAEDGEVDGEVDEAALAAIESAIERHVARAVAAASAAAAQERAAREARDAPASRSPRSPRSPPVLRERRRRSRTASCCATARPPRWRSAAPRRWPRTAATGRPRAAPPAS
ncbi:SMC family ATPase [Agrococcus beijingensis]|uniref:SMC family ATPase n=1 Tax=Agrococcus beijingensis TaxID=3068634 RepID=UPI002740D555|nr:SMC family ATPase [Agrococcus sp. REN33]